MWLYVAPCCFFFFQAEDGIRDLTVTGVQTCALPIFPCRRPLRLRGLRGFPGHAAPGGRKRAGPGQPWAQRFQASSSTPIATRSEEHTSELQSQSNLVCRLLLEKKKKKKQNTLIKTHE